MSHKCPVGFDTAEEYRLLNHRFVFGETNMFPEIIGILHPGVMGVSVTACALHSGHRVCYASEGQSDDTPAGG